MAGPMRHGWVQVWSWTLLNNFSSSIYSTVSIATVLEETPFPLSIRYRIAMAASDRDREAAILRVLASQNIWVLLRLSPDGEVRKLKKEFFNLCLLIHPDKCTHPDATRAIQHLYGLMDKMHEPVEAAAPKADEKK